MRFAVATFGVVLAGLCLARGHEFGTLGQWLCVLGMAVGLTLALGTILHTRPASKTWRRPK